MIKINSLVRYNTTGKTDLSLRGIPTDFLDGTPLVFLGEISNKPGTGIFATQTKTYIGLPIHNFEEISEDDT